MHEHGLPQKTYLQQPRSTNFRLRIITFIIKIQSSIFLVTLRAPPPGRDPSECQVLMLTYGDVRPRRRQQQLSCVGPCAELRHVTVLQRHGHARCQLDVKPETIVHHYNTHFELLLIISYIIFCKFTKQ